MSQVRVWPSQPTNEMGDMKELTENELRINEETKRHINMDRRDSDIGGGRARHYPTEGLMVSRLVRDQE